MTHEALNSALESIHKLAGWSMAGDLTDARLLEHFIVQRDEDAFALLVRRHGPLVLGVCRRVLQDSHDAEDAFQATFLVLARSAGALRNRESVAGWLYRVAHRIAVKQRIATARRRARERPIEDALPAADAPDPVWSDLRPILDDEVNRLPEKYRAPVRLCFLEGKTHEQAARDLGWPIGTVATRLARARVRLRSRLARRGVALPAGVLAVVLAQKAAPAAAPPCLMDSTIQAAVTGRTTPPVAALTEGWFKAMFMTKLKIAGVALCVVLVAGVGLVLGGAGGPPAPSRPKAPATPAAPGPVATLAQARLKAARSAYEMAWTFYLQGKDGYEDVYLWSDRWMDAQRDLSARQADQVAAIEAHLGRMKQLEKYVKAKVETGIENSLATPAMEFYRVEAELWLARVKAQSQVSPSPTARRR